MKRSEIYDSRHRQAQSSRVICGNEAVAAHGDQRYGFQTSQWDSIAVPISFRIWRSPSLFSSYLLSLHVCNSIPTTASFSGNFESMGLDLSSCYNGGPWFIKFALCRSTALDSYRLFDLHTSCCA